MFDILHNNYFNEHYKSGFINTEILLSNELIDDIKKYYLTKEIGQNDFPKFFTNNEHLAYLESRLLGFISNYFPKNSKKIVKNFYAKAYSKAIYCEQIFIKKVLQQLLQKNFHKIFKTRYMVASYDMYLCNDHLSPGAGIHTDLPNFHHFYETENDLSIYIPLVDLNEQNGGRIKTLPENKLKVPGNVLLKLLYEHFSMDNNCIDQNGYINPEKISQKSINIFIKSKSHQELMILYKNLISLARTQYKNDFELTTENKGQVLLFNNKNFHLAENWKNKNINREIYVIRMFPLYDIKIKLKHQLHKKRFNNYLIDTKNIEIYYYNNGIDVANIASNEKIKF